MENSPEDVTFHLKQQQHLILVGHTSMASLKNRRRFITHNIPLYDHSHHKMATLIVELRFISKQEVLDLMYSPTKLSPADKKQNTP